MTDLHTVRYKGIGCLRIPRPALEAADTPTLEKKVTIQTPIPIQTTSSRIPGKVGCELKNYYISLSFNLILYVERGATLLACFA